MTALAARREQGAALIVCMLMMLVLLMLGTSGAQIAIQEEKASRHELDRLVAFQAAEAALKDGEHDVEKLSRVEQFEMQGKSRAAGYCEAGMNNPFLGLCRPAPPEVFPMWQKIDLDGQVASVPYGYFTGRASAGADNAVPPGYLIEVLPQHPADEGRMDALRDRIYRITAIGYGLKERTQVVLQSYFWKGDKGQGRRLAWREILNWGELREVLEKE